jgi:hypothetical protein
MRWWLKTQRRRLWAIVIAGIGPAVSSLSVGATPLGAWAVAQDAVCFIGGLFGVAGLLGFGPLRTKPEPVESESLSADPFATNDQRSVDQLVYLAERRRAGEISQEGFEFAKKQILGS